MENPQQGIVGERALGVEEPTKVLLCVSCRYTSLVSLHFTPLSRLGAIMTGPAIEPSHVVCAGVGSAPPCTRCMQA